VRDPTSAPESIGQRIDVHCYLWSFAAHFAVFAREISRPLRIIVVYNEPPLFLQANSAQEIEIQCGAARPHFGRTNSVFLNEISRPVF
jgi:hypothetical protein